MPKEDAEYTKHMADLMLATKGFLDYGETKGLLTPEGLKFTITKRQEIVKQLVNSGVSQNKVAKTLGVDRKTVQRDLALNAPKSSAKRATPKKALDDAELPYDRAYDVVLDATVKLGRALAIFKHNKYELNPKRKRHLSELIIRTEQKLQQFKSLIDPSSHLKVVK